MYEKSYLYCLYILLKVDMAPLIVAWPGGIFPTANTVVKGGARRTRKQKKQKKRARTLKRKSMKSRRRL